MADAEAELLIEIDRAVCRGTGECVFRASRTFSLGGDGKARVADAPGDPRDRILGAARSCPHFAITVTSGGSRLV